MSTAAITLQCPNCGGVFLTLQQGGGGMEICPHCAVAAPRGSYRALQSGAAGPRARTDLPAKRVEKPQTAVAVVPPPLQGGVQPPLRSQTSRVYLSAFGASLGRPSAPQGAPLLPPEDAPFPQAPEQPASPYAVWQAAIGQLQGSTGQPAGPPPPSASTTTIPLPSSPEAWPSGVPVSFAPAFQTGPQPAPIGPSPPPQAWPAPAAEPPALTPSFVTTSPQAVSISVPAAPVPPPQIGFAPPVNLPSSGATFPAVGQPVSRVIAPSPGSVPHWAPVAASVPTPPEPEAVTAAPPVWPGLGVEQGARGPASSPPFIVGVQAQRPLPPKRERPPALKAETASPAKNGSPAELPLPQPWQARKPWGQWMLFLALAGALGWWAWQSSVPLSFHAGHREQEARKPVVGSAAPVETVERAEQVARALPSPQPEAQVPLREPLSQNLMVTDDAAMLTTVAKDLLHAMDEAATPDERMKWVAEPDSVRADVERLFSSAGGALAVTTVEPNPGLVIALPSGEAIKLFRAVTARCASGAVVRLHPRDGQRYVLDWPLFAQTHDFVFDSFVTAAAPTVAEAGRWFMVLCKRSRITPTAGSENDPWMGLDVQGSLSAAGTTRALVAKDSPAGRFLDARLDWGRVYLMKMLLSKRDVAGKATFVVVDCDGAAPVPPSAAKNP